MARTRITPVKIPASGGLNITDLTYDAIPATLGNGVDFVWAPNLLMLLWNPDDSQPPAHVLWVNSSAIDKICGVDGGGLSLQVLSPIILLGLPELNIVKCEKIFRQPSGLVWVDTFFDSYMKVVDLG